MSNLTDLEVKLNNFKGVQCLTKFNTIVLDEEYSIYEIRDLFDLFSKIILAKQERELADLIKQLKETE
jgi:hypothetical protein